MTDLTAAPPRKPVPHVTDAWGNPVDLSPRSNTIRAVPQEDSHPTDTTTDDDLTYLAPALSRLELGQPLHSNAPQNPIRQQNQKVPRRSLDKPLPDTPPLAARPDSGFQQQPLKFDARAHESSTDRLYGNSKADLERELGVSGVLDLHNSQDTTVHTRYAPAVTHETVVEEVREVRHEHIQRHIHTHDVYHRILPIHDVEVKPARHFFEHPDGTRHEVSPDQVPGRSPRLTHALLTECFKDTLPKSNTPAGPRNFSARDFPGTSGDYRERKTDDGTLQTERWWVHAPTLQKGGERTGQTKAFHFDDEDRPAA